MTRASTHADGDVDRAALAYSLLPVRFADKVNVHLSMAERQRLRDGLARVRNADDYARMDAIRALGAAVRRGVVFPRPPGHDDHDCPFQALESQPRAKVVAVLERLARRDALEVAVTLCHLSDPVRRDLWNALSADARAFLANRLAEVPLVRPGRTREYARDINTRLARLPR